ncbi:unnamed protein product [Hyaloperonospora brassicae]|uniref:FCP1 homology domain-containing protein n=1 Tax=Hyaloperonospora brassicae TaxID=162125 RepID=A0AAV0T8Z1_HYABA|nr:unnamed protein product [Hyaloperonospora brassicae]
MIFVLDWDEMIIAHLESIEDPNDIISIYPKYTEHLTDHGVDDLVQLMYKSQIETSYRYAMVQYAAPACIDKKDTPTPQLLSHLAAVRSAVQKKLKRRVRAILHLPVTKEDFGCIDLEKFGLGTKRTLEQWEEFSGIDPRAKFVSPGDSRFENCKQLEYVPLSAHDPQ